MESFYPAKALRTHFFYAEPHNAEMYYRFAPWERRYRRWLYSPNPNEIGSVSRVYAAYFILFAGASKFKFSSGLAAKRYGTRSGIKAASRMTFATMACSIWKNRWAPTGGLNG